MFKRKLDAEPVVHNLKDYDVVIDYCACMVAIILATHVVDASNVNVQWSASQLALILNNSPRGTNTNYYINVAALSHGFLLFRKDLKRKGLSLIEIYQEEKLVPCYYGPVVVEVQWVFFAWFWFLTSFWFSASNSFPKPSLLFFENLHLFQNHLPLFWKKQNWNEIVGKTI